MRITEGMVKSEGVFSAFAHKGRQGYVVFTTSVLLTGDEVTPMYEDDVVNSFFNLYTLTLAGTPVGYAIMPKRGNPKNCGHFLILASSKREVTTGGDGVLDLQYKIEKLRVYSLANSGVMIGYTNGVMDNMFNLGASLL